MTPQEYFDRIVSLRTPEEIERVCNELTSELFKKPYSPKTRINMLTPYNKMIKQISNQDLIEGQNAFIQTRHDGSLWKRHLHYKFTGITDTKWYGDDGVNTKTVVLDKLENLQEIKVGKYLDTALKLLTSQDPHELAVGLIAVSGRRPVEILVRGSFSQDVDIPDFLKKGYFVEFAGQVKKRDYDKTEKETYRIGLLVPAYYFLEQFNRLREMPESVELLEVVKAETEKGTSPEAINEIIDNRRGKSLRRVASREFGEILPVRFNDENINNKGLRAVYARLITERDCPKTTSDLLWASRAMGHFIDTQKPDDSELKNLVTTLGYFDYYVDSPVPFINISSVEDSQKLSQVRAYKADADTIKDLQKKWELENQQDVVNKLIVLAMETESLRGKLADMEDELKAKQDNQDKQMEVSAPTKDDFRPMIQEMIAEALQEILPQLQQQFDRSEVIKPEVTESVTPKVTEVDSEVAPIEKVKSSKNKGNTDEKIQQSFEAICQYNEQQSDNNLRWYIGNRALRELAGCNGQIVTDWMNRNKSAIENANGTYGLGEYHNKKHKKHKKAITQVISR